MSIASPSQAVGQISQVMPLQIPAIALCLDWAKVKSLQQPAIHAYPSAHFLMCWLFLAGFQGLDLLH